jgi:hypothetical protein
MKATMGRCFWRIINDLVKSLVKRGIEQIAFSSIVAPHTARLLALFREILLLQSTNKKLYRRILGLTSGLGAALKSLP